jgi:hypothetical protein
MRSTQPWPDKHCGLRNFKAFDLKAEVTQKTRGTIFVMSEGRTEAFGRGTWGLEDVKKLIFCFRVISVGKTSSFVDGAGT